MNLAAIKQAVTSKAGIQMLKLQKQSPHILFGVGVVGVVATAVTASRATLHVEGVLVDHQIKMGMIEGASDLPDEKYSSMDAQRDKVVLYSQTILKLVKLYSPTILIGTASIGALVGSHHIMSARNAALAAAFGSMETAFERYRAKVIEQFGADKDREFRYETEQLQVIEETETGPQPKDLTRVDADKSPYLYAKIFGPDNKNWERKPEWNVMFLRSQQNYLNDKLRAQGHLFLNEVYDTLGLERTRVGSVVGWLWQGDGDNYVDFGIWDPDREGQFYDFITGREGAILLDFNVDGNIWDKI